MSETNSSVAIYCRLSKDDLSFGESSSISTQKMILKKYAQMRQWSIHEIYVDDGWSGANFDRPAFEKMIADIETGLINIVLVKDLSRLGRNHLNIIQTCTSRRIRFNPYPFWTKLTHAKHQMISHPSRISLMKCRQGI